MTSQLQGDVVKIAVEDDGVGISKGSAKRLFTPFDRLGQQERAKVEGTGLGLVLSKSLVESLDGEIGYEALPNGSRFWFSLRLNGGDDSESAAAQPPIAGDLLCPPK